MHKISIIVPCYNHAQYLDTCLQSVLEQKYENWECIIINDGSPDNTREIAIRWLNVDSRFKYLEQQNGGLCSARNFGINNSIGTWILPLDADNYLNCEYLCEASKYFNDDFTIIYSNARKFGLIDEQWIFPDFSLTKMAIFNIIENCSFFKKEDFDKVGGYDERMIYGLEDWEFWISLLKDGGNVKHLPIVGFNYRVDAKSMISLLSPQKQNDMIRYIERKHIDFFHDYLGTFHELTLINLDLNSKVNGRIYRCYSFISKLVRGK